MAVYINCLQTCLMNAEPGLAYRHCISMKYGACRHYVGFITLPPGISCCHYYTMHDVMKVLPQARLSPIQRLRLAALHNESCYRSTTFRIPKSTATEAALLRGAPRAAVYLGPPWCRLVHPLHYRLQRFPNLLRHCYFPHTVRRLRHNVKKRVTVTTNGFQNKSLPEYYARHQIAPSSSWLVLQLRFSFKELITPVSFMPI